MAPISRDETHRPTAGATSMRLAGLIQSDLDLSQWSRSEPLREEAQHRIPAKEVSWSYPGVSKSSRKQFPIDRSLKRSGWRVSYRSDDLSVFRVSRQAGHPGVLRSIADLADFVGARRSGELHVSAAKAWKVSFVSHGALVILAAVVKLCRLTE